MNKNEEEYNQHIMNLERFQKNHRKEIEGVKDAYLGYVMEFMDFLEKGLREKEVDEIEVKYLCTNIAEQNLLDFFNIANHIADLSVMRNQILTKIEKRNKKKMKKNEI